MSVPAPVIPGYPSACWTWNRRFQCIETEPQMFCDSGTPYATVKRDCNLTKAVIKARLTINGISYITDADYTYRCAYGAPTTDDSLPVNRECIPTGDVEVTHGGYVPAAPVGATPGSAPLSTTIPTTETSTQNYVCYAPPVTNCTNECYKTVTDPATGTPKQVPTPCTSPVSQCTITSTNCQGSITGTNGQLDLGPDGRCVNSVTQEVCQAGEIPRCLTDSNCQLSETNPSSVQDNGVALTQDQKYICSNTTRTCTQLAELSNCVHANAWGWDDNAIINQIGQGLGEYNRAVTQLEGIDKGMDEEDPYIFSGRDLRCSYAVGNFLNTAIMIAVAIAIAVAVPGGGLVASSIQSGATTAFNAGLINMGQFVSIYSNANNISIAISAASAFVSDAPNSQAFGGNCCKEHVIEGSDKPWKLRECTADEVRLSVAKQKGLAYYLGEYCAKRGGFPIKQCVLKTKTYCVFEDMLALVVNEQGRMQLDEIARADTATTSTSAATPFQLFSPTPAPSSVPKYSGYLNTGVWAKRFTHNGSQVWSWQYPGYCANSTLQKAAYEKHQAEINAAADMKGIKPDQMTKREAWGQLLKILDVKPFQECASTPGTLSFMTCAAGNDSCNTSKLPEGPTGVEVDLSGNDISQHDPNWQIQQIRSFYEPGDYGVTGVLPSAPSFAAVSTSLNEYVTATGSCKKLTGSCMYQLSVTNKAANGGQGPRKRTKEAINFPLYTVVPNSAWPGINYMDSTGAFSTSSYLNDKNRGLGDALEVSKHRFIFHPHFITKPVDGNIHSKFLLEHANKRFGGSNPADDFTPMAVPTDLPPGTSGWYPHGSGDKAFYLSGKCEPGSKWCNYTVEVDLNVPRHPWGTAREPRCWGFTIEQMAALDFDRMDLSRWINSLDLDSMASGMTEEAGRAMSEQVVSSAQNFYGAMASNTTMENPAPGTKSLVLDADSLPRVTNNAFEAYTLTVGVPANWPIWYLDQPNNNAVTNVKVDWGDGSAPTVAEKHSTNQAWFAQHDYGDKDPGRYKVTVTLDTHANGSQRLTSFVTLVPDKGGMPEKSKLDEFDNPGTNGRAQAEIAPSQTLGGMNQSPSNLQTQAPGMVDRYGEQGPSVTVPTED